jgi:hypothetical protein
MVWVGPAHAIDQDTRSVIRGGTYGLIGGTVVGLAVLPLTGSVRGVFIGSSLGLYMGILLGVYHITHRDDPENPFRGQVFEQTPVEGGRIAFDGISPEGAVWPARNRQILNRRDVLIAWPVYRF